MSMIFPGMDPYLEGPQIWPGVHSRLIVYIADQLQPLLRPRYVAAIEERVFVEGADRHIVPDLLLKSRPAPRAAGGAATLECDEPLTVQVAPIEIHETYIAILDRQSGKEVVTVIEVVSPTNKFPGSGRDSYLEKQREVRHSGTHLVEVDLLRAGSHVVSIPEWSARERASYDYLVCVNRARPIRSAYEIYPRALRDRLPRIRIPLADGDPDVRLDIQAALEQVYDAGSYRDLIDYGARCEPRLSDDDQRWANVLAQATP